MAKTKIQWTNHTWNPVVGCRRVSPGCENCYAERQARRIAFMHPTGPYPGVVKTGAMGEYLPLWNGTAKFLSERLAKPLGWRKPRKVFVNSMSDLFHEDVTFEQIAAVFGVMAASPRHTFQVLTKRAKRMREWFEWLDNITDPCGGFPLTVQVLENAAREVGVEVKAGSIEWPLSNVHLGVSAEDQERLDERVPDVLACPAAVRWLSIEPLLNAVNLHEYLLGFSAGNPSLCTCGHGHGFFRCPNYGSVAESCHFRGCSCESFTKIPGGTGLHWIVVGGESGRGARRCDLGWIRSVIAQCRKAQVPCFVKQLGAGVNLHTDDGRGRHHRDRDRDEVVVVQHPKGGDWDEWPDDLRVREWPSLAGASA